MGVGHAALALTVARTVPCLNAGWLVFASLLADFLLGIFAWMGLEQAHVPADYPHRHYLTFTFPYSHGLAPLLLWGALLGTLIALLQSSDRQRIFLTVAAVVLSHFFLDSIVHVVGLPLAGESSPKVAFGLWNYMPFELILETLMTIGALVLYWRVKPRSAISRYGIAVFMILFAALTWTQLFMTTPPESAQLIPSWIAFPLVCGAIVYALDGRRLAQAVRPKFLPG